MVYYRAFQQIHQECKYYIVLRNTKNYILILILQMYMNHIVIGTDSRGRGLREFISRKNYFPQCHIHLGVFPGGKFSKVVSNVLDEVDRISRQQISTSSIHAYVGAGICDFTTKTKYKKGSKINYIPNSTNIYTLKHDIATYYHTTHFNDTYAKILHIPPASLADYYDFYMPLPLSDRHTFLSEQRHLEEDINFVNKYISNLNHKYRKRSVRWDKELQKSKQKRKGRSKKVKVTITTPSYKDLYDGVHPSDQPSEKWFSFLCRSIESDLKECPEEPLSHRHHLRAVRRTVTVTLSLTLGITKGLVFL